MVDGVDVVVVTLAIGLSCLSDLSTQYTTFRLTRGRAPDDENDPQMRDGFEVDWARTGRWCLWPATPSVLVTAFTYEKVIPAMSPRQESVLSVTIKVLLRVLSHAAGAFFGLVGNRLLAGDKKEAVVERLKEYFLPCAVIHCGIWLPADIVQFTLIPLQYQVLWIYCYNLFAGIAVCYFANAPILGIDHRDL
eukprot:EG_transcript_27773